MSNIKQWVRTVISNAGIPVDIASQLVESEPENALKSLHSLRESTINRNDDFGLLSSGGVAMRKRKGIQSVLPTLRYSTDLAQVFIWIKVLSQSRIRCLRSSVTLSSMYLVEQVLMLITTLNGASGDIKPLINFCSKIASTVVLVRCRDTCPIVRGIVAEYICRWASIHPDVFHSSVFGKSFAIQSCMSNLLIDDSAEVRRILIENIVKVVNKHMLNRFKWSQDFIEIVLQSFVSRCEDVHDDTSLEIEVHEHADLIEVLIRNGPHLIDQTQQGKEYLWDHLYQLLWDGSIPLPVRKTISAIVSKHVLAEDILNSQTAEWDKGIRMIQAFTEQYNPYPDKQDVDNFFVFDSFFSSLDQVTLSGYLGCAMFELAKEAGSLKSTIIESIASIIERNSFTALVPSCEPLFANLLDLNILNALILMIDSVADSCIPADDTLLFYFENALNEIRSYSHFYLLFKLWSKLGFIRHSLDDSLQTYGNNICSRLTTETLMQIHALESAVRRPIADLGTMDKLVDFISAGELPTIELITCAIDLVLIQTLKEVHNERDRALVDELKRKLSCVVRSLLNEGERDCSVEGLRLATFCKYRTKLLCEMPSKKDRGFYVAEKSTSQKLLRPNGFILTSFFEKQPMDHNLVSLIE
jgi:hypothetical protein